MRPWTRYAVAALALAGQADGAWACELPAGWTVMTPDSETAIRAALTSDPSPIPLHAPFEVTVGVCAPDGDTVDRITFDATMPAHGHGMNYAPEITQGEAGRYKLSGLLFHMPGLWQASLTVYSGGKPTYFTLDIEVE